MAKRSPAPVAGGLRDAVLAGVTKARHGKAPWWHSLPAEVLEELRQLRSEFYAGKIPSSRWRLSASIAARLTERGYPGCTQLVVDRWLAQRD